MWLTGNAIAHVAPLQTLGHSREMAERSMLPNKEKNNER